MKVIVDPWKAEWEMDIVRMNCGETFQFLLVFHVLSGSVTSWTIAHQNSLSFTISWSLLKLTSIESVMPSSHLILSHPLVLLPSVFPSIRVFSSESALCIQVAKVWEFPVNTQGWFPLGLTGLISLLFKGHSRVFSRTTVRKHQFFSNQLSLQSNSRILYMTTGKTIAFTLWIFVGKVMSLLFNTLSRFARAFLPRRSIF